MTKHGLWLLGLLLATAYGRDPFQPPIRREQCQAPEKTGQRRWQLLGTVLSADQRTARFKGPDGQRYPLRPGQYLPQTGWRVEAIQRRQVILGNASGCLPSLWQFSLQSKRGRNGQNNAPVAAVDIDANR